MYGCATWKTTGCLQWPPRSRNWRLSTLAFEAPHFPTRRTEGKGLQLVKVTESSYFIDLRELKWGENVERGIGWNKPVAWDAPWYRFLGNGYLATLIHLSWLPSLPPNPFSPPLQSLSSSLPLLQGARELEVNDNLEKQPQPEDLRGSKEDG